MISAADLGLAQTEAATVLRDAMPAHHITVAPLPVKPIAPPAVVVDLPTVTGVRGVSPCAFTLALTVQVIAGESLGQSLAADVTAALHALTGAGYRIQSTSNRAVRSQTSVNHWL